MRRSDKEVKDLADLREIIESCLVCRIAMIENSLPYIVPMNFGCSVDGSELILYFHSAKEGRKMEIMRQNSQVAFEMDCQHQLIAAEKACQYGFVYASIIGHGRVEFIESALEKAEALNLIMKHQTGKTFSFGDAELQSVCVYKIVVEAYTGKKHAAR